VVYCHNCKHRDEKYCKEYCLPVAEVMNLRAYKPPYDGIFVRAVANVHYSCPHYKRVWYKFWVKEE